MLRIAKSTKLALGLSLLVGGCASADDAGRAAIESDAASSGRVVTKLRFRDVDLVISGAESGTRFSVIERGRMPLASGLEEADFRRHYPDLYEVYRTGLAQSPYLDARLDQPRVERRSTHRF